MTQVLQYHASTEDQITLILSGLVVVFAFHLLVFRWVERSAAVTATYFLTSITLVGGPFIAANLPVPDQLLSIYDGAVIWTLLSFFATMIGIALSNPEAQKQ